MKLFPFSYYFFKARIVSEWVKSCWFNQGCRKQKGWFQLGHLRVSSCGFWILNKVKETILAFINNLSSSCTSSACPTRLTEAVQKEGVLKYHPVRHHVQPFSDFCCLSHCFWAGQLEFERPAPGRWCWGWQIGRLVSTSRQKMSSYVKRLCNLRN